MTTFELAATAEMAGYRACLRCRPYRMIDRVAPNAPELVCRAVQMIIAGALDDGDEAALGQRLAISARHLRRLFRDHVGVTPSQLAYSRRAHFARRLLDDSDLTITEVAFASGFSSVRHFNRAMRDVFRSAPRDLRKRRRRRDRLIADGGLTLRLPFDPPENEIPASAVWSPYRLQRLSTTTTCSAVMRQRLASHGDECDANGLSHRITNSGRLADHLCARTDGHSSIAKLDIDNRLRNQR